jgi:hypothetical protein
MLDVLGWEINILTVLFFWHIEMYLNEQVEEYSLKEEEIMNT